jgi:hypothetical protein
MTTKQLENLYRTACAGKGYEGNEGQFKIWKQTLQWCEEADLAQALVWYFSDNINFPMPAELKALAGRAMRERTSKLAIKTDLVGWYCPECGIHMSAFLPPGSDTTRVCKGVPRVYKGEDVPCGAIMQEMYRRDSGDVNKHAQRA